MNKCLHCGIRIADQTDVCPLCQCVVDVDEDTPEAERYPDIRLKGRKLELIGRIVLFLDIVLGALAVLVNYMQEGTIWWSGIVVGGLGYMLLILFFFIENEHAGYRSKALTGVACGAAYMVLIDYILGFRHWSLNYGIPSALMIMDVMIVAVMFVNLRNL